MDVNSRLDESKERAIADLKIGVVDWERGGRGHGRRRIGRGDHPSGAVVLDRLGGDQTACRVAVGAAARFCGCGPLRHRGAGVADPGRVLAVQGVLAGVGDEACAGRAPRNGPPVLLTPGCCLGQPRCATSTPHWSCRRQFPSRRRCTCRLQSTGHRRENRPVGQDQQGRGPGTGTSPSSGRIPTTDLRLQRSARQ